MGGDVGVVKFVDIIKNDTSGLGFSVLGGAGSHLPPIVYDILDGSPAAATGELETGDIILEVNGEGVSHLSTKELLKCLRLAKGSVLLTLKRDEAIAQRVNEYLSSANTVDSLRSAITDRDLSHVRDVIAVRSNASTVPGGSSSAATRTANNGCQSNGRNTRQPTVPVAHSPPERRPRPSPLAPPSADNGHTHRPLTTPTFDDDHAHRSISTPTTANSSVGLSGTGERPRYEAFTMTGDVMLCLSRRPVHAAVLPGAVPQAPPSQSPVPRPQSPPSSTPVSQCNGSSTIAAVSNGSIAENGAASRGLADDAEDGVDGEVCGDELAMSDRCLLSQSSPPPSPAPASPACRSSRHLPAESTHKQSLNTTEQPDSADDASAQTVTEEREDEQSKVENRSDHGNAHEDSDRAENQHEALTPEETNTATVANKQQVEDQEVMEESSGRGEQREGSSVLSEQASVEEDDDVSVDSDSLNSFTCHLPERAKKAAEAVGASVDVPSAKRLAYRLFALDGFKKRDVSCLLSKNNQFSQVVAAEYSKLFEFGQLSLDAALRQFLSHFVLSGETQERERILVHFSQRFVADNPDSFRSADACHTLTCALMLLNTDLHGRRVSRKMSCSQFIDNLDGLNEGANFSRDVLKSLYKAIKNKPLLHSLDDGEGEEAEANRSNGSSKTLSLGRNGSLYDSPLLHSPNSGHAVEYKRGYVMRKCCVQPNGRKAGVRLRSWRMLYCSLRELILFVHRDENASRAPNAYSDLSNAISIHHALASKATNYFKKEHVFRLQTADQAEYLVQTSDARELQAWIDAINLSAATHSSPPLAASVSNQKRFQRPLLPAVNTTLNMEEQYGHLETRLAQIGGEIVEMDAQPPAKNARSHEVSQYRERYTYLKYEIERYRVYLQCLGDKLAQFTAPSAPNPAFFTTAQPPLKAAATTLLNGSGASVSESTPLNQQRLAAVGHVTDDVTAADSPDDQSDESRHTRL